MAEGKSVETTLPTLGPETQVTSSNGKWAFLKKIPFFNSGPKKVDGPIPGVTPASPEQLSTPVVSLPQEQNDIDRQTRIYAEKEEFNNKNQTLDTAKKTA